MVKLREILGVIAHEVADASDDPAPLERRLCRSPIAARVARTSSREHRPLACSIGAERLSMAGALAYAPDGSATTLLFSMQPGSYNDDALMAFLSELRDHLDGAKATVIWDGLMSHRSNKMKAF